MSFNHLHPLDGIFNHSNHIFSCCVFAQFVLKLLSSFIIYFDFFPLPLEKPKDEDPFNFVEIDSNEEGLFFLAPTFPAHTFARVVFNDKGFDLLHFNPDWLEKKFKEKKIRLKHEINQQGTVILTAPSKDLQKFVEKYADDPAMIEMKT